MAATRNLDPAHLETEKILANLEKRVAKVYKQASDEMTDKITAFFDKFKKSDAEKVKQVKAGEITEQEHKQWRLSQMARGERFVAMRDVLAERMTKANEVAAVYINDATPGVYALNRNYCAYTIEQIGGNVGFTLLDESTVKRLVVEQPETMPYYPPERAVQRGIDLAWGKRQITAQVTSGILQGNSIPDIAKRLQVEIPTMEKASAVRAARTAMTGAQNGGRMASYKQADSMGVKVRKRWVATKDMRTRSSHAKLDGETIDWDEKFSNGLMFPGDPDGAPGEVYNCFTGETKVASDSETVRSYKHMYCGSLITVESAGGVKFTCTPNHPILTPTGWVRAELLNEKDDILVTSFSDNIFSGVNPYIKHGFSRFDAVHELINKLGRKRTCRLGVNFHGDVPTSDVEIVTKKRFLRKNRNAGKRKPIAKFFFKLTDKAFSCFCSFIEHFLGIWEIALCHICCKSVFLSLLFGHFGHPNNHGFRSTTDVNVSLPKYPINNLPTETIIRSELLNGLSGKVFIDKIVSVKISSAQCHVYNLQTQNGYYFVNSSITQNGGKCNGIAAIAKNCRCTMRTVEKEGIEAEPRKMRVRDPKTGRNVLVSEMTYKEWEEWVKRR